MAEKKKKTQARKKTAKPPHKKWRWRFAKFLLVLVCFALVGVIFLVQFLESETIRMGIFPAEQAAPAEQTVAREPSSPPVSEGMTEDITSDEKQKLDAILQSRSE